MTLGKILSIALRRVGLSDGATAFTDNARDYFNVGLRNLCEQRQWRWLFKNSSFTTVSGTQTYSLGSDVMRPLSFRNTTDNHKMEIVDSDWVDRRDPNDDDTGIPYFLFISGINSTTGYWEVDLFQIPDTTGSTINYRYFAYVADKTSSDDATDLAGDLPPWAQNALIYYIASMYKGELGDIQGEQDELGLYFNSVNSNIKVDAQAESGDQNHRARRYDSSSNNFRFTVNEGSLT
jgi:hypothetical protein